jgi:hypothetical protein
VVARAPSTLSPIDTPCRAEVRGISDGPRASSADTVSSGAPGDATTGFCHRASRRSRSDQSTSPSTLLNRRIAMPPEAVLGNKPLRQQGEPSSP